MADDNRNPYASELLTPPGFLIIGITGPWGSGCTTTAEMIEKSTRESTAKYLSSALVGVGMRIDECRARLADDGRPQAESRGIRAPRLQVLDPTVRVDKYYRSGATERPDGLRGHYHSLLKKLLEQRRWMEALLRAADADDNGLHGWQRFQRLSMSDMVIKMAIEQLDDYDESHHDPRFKPIVERLREFRNHECEAFRAAKDLRKLLEEKDYPKLRAATEAGERFEQYLSDIADLQRIIHVDYSEISYKFLQDCGDSLRKLGEAFPPQSAKPDPLRWGARIAEEANLCTKYFQETRTAARTKWFVIECFRNRIEVEHFRRRVENFFLFSVYASSDDRWERKKDQFSNVDLNYDQKKERFIAIEKRDRGGEEDDDPVEALARLNVGECVAVSDVAIVNEGKPNCSDGWRGSLQRSVFRHLALIMEPGCCPPTNYEASMNLASATELQSACISRHVGAVVVGKMGHVLAVGWNDPGMGQLGCGILKAGYFRKGASELGGALGGLLEKLEAESGQLIDRQKYDVGRDPDRYICYKDEASRIQTGRKIAELHSKEDKEAFDEALMRNAHELNIKRLEYCRALHAEENALLQVAKLGGISVEGGKIYTTASPCELCTKKIYQAGISEIVYIDAYPGTFADAFRKDGVRRITFTQFEGVKSPGYFRLFKPDYPLKDAQKLR